MVPSPLALDAVITWFSISHKAAATRTDSLVALVIDWPTPEAINRRSRRTNRQPHKLERRVRQVVGGDLRDENITASIYGTTVLVAATLVGSFTYRPAS